MLEEVSKIYLEDKTPPKKCKSHRPKKFCSRETFYSMPKISNKNKIHVFAVLKKNTHTDFFLFQTFRVEDEKF